MSRAVTVTMRRNAHGIWYAEIPFAGCTGALGHQGCNPFNNTPWLALATALQSWDWWRLRRENMHLDYAEFVRRYVSEWERR